MDTLIYNEDTSETSETSDALDASDASDSESELGNDQTNQNGEFEEPPFCASVILTSKGFQKIMDGENFYDLPLKYLRKPPRFTAMNTIGDFCRFIDKNYNSRKIIEYRMGSFTHVSQRDH